MEEPMKPMETLYETVEMMCSEDHRERLIAEYNQVRIRKLKIDARCDVLKAPYEEYKQLDEQRKVMEKYMSILAKRMDRLF